MKGMASPPAPADVATGVIELAMGADQAKGKAFFVSAKGLEAAA
jgi:hypothetical protein